MMDKKMGIGIALVAVVAIGGGMVASGVFDRRSDEEKIQAALQRAIRASKEGRPGGVVELISRDFELNGQKFNTAQIAKTIKDVKPNVDVASTNPTIGPGDMAMISSPVTLSLNLPPVSITLKRVDMEFVREDGFKFLVFPTRDWKITRVKMPEEVYQELSSQYGM